MKRISLSFNERISTRFLGYVLALMAVLITALIVFAFSTINMMDQRNYDHTMVTLDKIFTDVNQEDMHYALAQTNGLVDYMELINEDLIVMDSANSPHIFSYQYTQEEIDRIKADDANYITYNPFQDSEALFIAYAPQLLAQPIVYDIIIYNILGFSAVFGVLLILINIAFRSQFVHPILEMKNAVEDISKGNYRPLIAYESKNELNVLKSALLDMGSTLEQQMHLIKNAETERKKLVLNMSHDIRTPLTNIAGYAETLRDKETPEVLKQQAIEVIYHNAQRAKHLINKLFEFAKYDSEQMQAQLTETHLQEAIRQTLIHQYSHLESQDITLNIDMPDEPILCLLDQMIFDRVLGNLITNSMHYAHDRTTLDISLVHTPRGPLLSLSDVGPGIPDQIKDSLFNPFITGDEARSVDSGTGLGLAIVKRLIDKLGATITLDDTYHKGVKWLIQFTAL